MEVMINEEIVTDSLNLKEEHIKACKEDLEILEKGLESDEMEMMMNQYRTLIRYKVEDQKELEEIKRRQEEEIEADEEDEIEKAELGDNQETEVESEKVTEIGIQIADEIEVEK